MQFQFQYTPLNTSAVIDSATAVLISASTQRRGPTKVEMPMTLVIDSISGGSTGTAGIVVFSAAGTVVHRVAFGTSGGQQANPIHIELAQGDSLSAFASGSTGVVNIGFHRK